MTRRTAAGFVHAPALPAMPNGDQSDDITGGLVLSDENVPEIENCLGAITMAPGAVSAEAVAHDTTEVMYVASGSGELRTETETIAFRQGDAIFIPAGEWHSLANTGAEPLVSVFSFPTPARPHTRSKPSSAAN